MMEVRRTMMGVIAQMASGAKFVKGTFTVPNDNSSSYTINFGQSFDKYMFYVEMTEDSKTDLLGTEIDGSRAFMLFGTSITPNCKGYTYNNNFLAYRVNPSTKATSYSGNNPKGIDNSSMSLPSYDVSASATNALFKGYTYNYYIVEIN